MALNSFNALFSNYSFDCFLDHGTRRPTKYPEWVTLEVRKGGFATGTALALLADSSENYTYSEEDCTPLSPPYDFTRDSRSLSSDFLTPDGIAALETLLLSGQYRIEHPENAALLVFVWLLRVGRAEEAKSIFDQMAPYLSKLRFYPHAPKTKCTGDDLDGEGAFSVAPLSHAPSAAPITHVHLQTVRALSRELVSLANYDDWRENSVGRCMKAKRQRAVANEYAALQADAIALLLTTVPDAPAFLSDTNDDATNTLFMRCPQKGNNNAQNDTNDAEEGDDDDDDEGYTLFEELLARADNLAQRCASFGGVPSHEKSSSTTAIILNALRHPATADIKAVSERIRAVAKSRGVKGTERFEAYMARTRQSAPIETRTAETCRMLSKYLLEEHDGDDGGFVEGRDIRRAVEKVAPTSLLPPPVLRALRRAEPGAMRDLLRAKALPSVDTFAALTPQVMTKVVAGYMSLEGEKTAQRASTGICIANKKEKRGSRQSAEGRGEEDDGRGEVSGAGAVPLSSLQHLFVELSLAFSRRRSVLLYNMERQVRLEEIPWARPLLQLICTDVNSVHKGTPHPSEVYSSTRRRDGAATRDCAGQRLEEAVLELASCYFEHYPWALVHNRMVRTMKDTVRRFVSSSSDLKARRDDKDKQACTSGDRCGGNDGSSAAPAIIETLSNLTEELAADIFEHDFSRNFDEAAYCAAKQMRNTPYSIYYGLDGVYDQIIRDYSENQKKLFAQQQAAKEELESLEREFDPNVDYGALAKKEERSFTLKYFRERGEVLPGTSKEIIEEDIAPLLSPRAREAREELAHLGKKYTNLPSDLVPLTHKLRMEYVPKKYAREAGKRLVGFEDMGPETPRMSAAVEERDAIVGRYDRFFEFHDRIRKDLEEKARDLRLLYRAAYNKVNDWQNEIDDQISYDRSCFFEKRRGRFNQKKTDGPPANRIHPHPHTNTPARNARLIEASMVITTHNVSQLLNVVLSRGSKAKRAETATSAQPWGASHSALRCVTAKQEDSPDVTTVNNEDIDVLVDIDQSCEQAWAFIIDKVKSARKRFEEASAARFPFPEKTRDEILCRSKKYSHFVRDVAIAWRNFLVLFSHLPTDGDRQQRFVEEKMNEILARKLGTRSRADDTSASSTTTSFAWRRENQYLKKRIEISFVDPLIGIMKHMRQARSEKGGEKNDEEAFRKENISPVFKPHLLLGSFALDVCVSPAIARSLKRPREEEEDEKQ